MQTTCDLLVCSDDGGHSTRVVFGADFNDNVHFLCCPWVLLQNFVVNHQYSHVLSKTCSILCTDVHFVIK